MKKLFLGVLASLLMASVAVAEYVPVLDTQPTYPVNGVDFIHVDDLRGADGINGIDGLNGIDGVDGVDGVDGTDGTDGLNGTNGTDADATALYNQLKAASTALSSVELNPDHEGFSIGIGASLTGGTNAGAIGLMYGVVGKDYSIGWNVKAYKAEGGTDGVGVGVTVGF